MRLGADHGKNGGRLHGAPLVGLDVLQFHGFQVLIARHFTNLSVTENLDVFLRLYSERQVARHTLGEIGAANHKQNLLSALGEEHCRLSGGVAATGHDHRRFAAELPFDGRSSVVNTSALEALAPLGVDTIVVCAGGYNDALRS